MTYEEILALAKENTIAIKEMGKSTENKNIANGTNALTKK